MSDIINMIDAAKGDKEIDLLIKNVNYINVLSGEIYQTNVAVADGKIIGFDYYDAKEVIDGAGQYICPGLIDAHVHLESSMVAVPEFAKAVVPNGTTTVITDPHEIANVLGLEGIKYIVDSSSGLPLNVFIMLPSCVPATHLETSGARISSQDLKFLFGHPRIIGLAEMMNFPGVLFKDKEVLAKIEAAGDRPIDGHAPGLSGKNLAAYIAAGIASDHECTNQAEALEKLRMGMHIMIREGTTARNLKSLLPIVNKNNSMQCSFCTDDRHPEDLLTEGHINSIVKESVKSGLDIVTAIQIATISTAKYFGLKKKGALVPGWDADFIIFDNPDNFNITSVYSKGIKVAKNGKYLFSANNQMTAPIRNTVGVNWLKLDFKIEPPDSSKKSVKAKIVGVIPTQIVTNTIIEELQIKNNEVISAPEKDIIKMAVIERHTGSGNVGVCFVKGFGLKAGAIASSVAHDSHNIIVVGTNDKDMTTAAIEIVKMGGGQAAVKNDDILASIPLNIAGLMSNLSIEEMKNRIKKITAAAKDLGCVLDDPFMTMSFLALPVIPELKLTDKGLVDITKFDFISMFE